MTLCLRAEGITPCSCSQHSQLSSGCAVLERMGQCRATSAHLGDSHLRVNPVDLALVMWHMWHAGLPRQNHSTASISFTKTRSGVGNLRMNPDLALPWTVFGFFGCWTTNSQWMMMVVGLLGCLGCLGCLVVWLFGCWMMMNLGWILRCQSSQFLQPTPRFLLLQRLTLLTTEVAVVNAPAPRNSLTNNSPEISSS